jgi:hypothetical protein
VLKEVPDCRSIDSGGSLSVRHPEIVATAPQKTSHAWDESIGMTVSDTDGSSDSKAGSVRYIPATHEILPKAIAFVRNSTIALHSGEIWSSALLAQLFES